jgi:glycosyltransferase involved in cell wall biosynthesis
METIYLNGKFTAQATTGVQRVARCMLAALDRRLAGDPRGGGRRWVLLCPPGGMPPALSRIEVQVVGSARAGLHVWEQAFLPRASRDGLLVNLAGSAPAFAVRQACTLHDAAVFDRPEAYSKRFRSWYRWLFRHLARTAVTVTTVSAFSRDRLVERLAIPAARIAVIHSGGDHLEAIAADPSFLAMHGLAGRRFLLAVGSENVNKNIAALVEAFAMLGDDDPLLVIAGGSHRSVFASSGHVRASAARVRRLGAVDDAGLKALYGAAEALVFVSLYEGFGLPPLEAMSCGCPVLASTAASIPEVCGNAAHYVDPASATAIADGLKTLLGAPDLRAELVQRGRKRLALFTWDSAAARLQAHLETHAAAPVPLPVNA